MVSTKNMRKNYMKKHYLIFFGITLLTYNLYIKVPKAEEAFVNGVLVRPVFLTVEQVYALDRERNILPLHTLGVLNGFAYGVTSGALYEYFEENQNPKDKKQDMRILNCLSKAIGAFDNIIFRNYEVGNISGKNYYGGELYKEARRCRLNNL